LFEATQYEAAHPTQDHHFKHKIANNLGMVYLEKGNFSKAEEVFRGSYKQMKETLSESPMTLLMPLGNLASLYSEWGKFDEAESYYLKAWDFVTQYQLEDLAEAGFIAHNLGGLYVQKGQYTLANRYLHQAKKLAQKLGENHILFATSLNSLGFYHFTLGNYEKAEKLLFQAQQVERRFRSEFSMLNAQIQSNLGSLYSELGFAEKAERYFTGSLRIQEKIQGDKHPQRAQFLNNIGLHYTHFFQHQKALTHYLEAKKICENAFEDESPLLGSVLANLADNYRSTQNPEAEKLFLRTLTIAEKTKGKHHPDILNIKNNLAILYLDLERLEESEKILKDLIETQKDIYKNHPEYAIAVSNLALVSLRAKHIKNAVYYGKKSWKLLLKNLTRLLPALAEKERQHYFQSFSGNIEFLKNLAIQTHREFPEMAGHLYDLLLATKAVLTDQAEVLRQRIFSTQDPALQNSFQNWREEREELISHYLGRKALSPSQLTEKEYHADQLEKALYQQSKRFVQVKNNRTVSWEDIKTTLKPGEAAIEFFQYRPWGKGGFQQSAYCALIIHPEQKDFPQLVIFPEHENWETRLASQYQGYIYSGQAETRGLFWENIAEWTDGDVHHFFKNCWHPIHVALQKNSPAKKIYLSNAGVFHKINLETIFWPEREIYLGDYYDFHLLTSTGKIAETVHSSQQTDIKSGSRQAILIGGVDFKNSAQETN
ncbi:MAG: tetratricopeptide repeat protein, partial [Bacteroidetes bacterium]|nr:tetratricopeptide repeat protein [Bacteroidota bacterium]